ncbi:branched-chain amino acid ABC transporter permease [Deinococcus hopiensis]|uniref:Amino acid/amide ABC transporter membrane protein 1, HAAT family n=1 Tax=Deinococcus hopiensis KR-140 TaxID=695939 RepID=A0A1W1VI17_9DEIO|nr:branched-chain amino acid ABC transporter permease [Deinococcus hopiensis]SMB93025.1 amino acid/amide ABC transporter membrane protein 1, HAAT family [Deinococcus hopiensis KR-140]
MDLQTVGTILLQVLVGGLSLGVLYAIVALGYTMVYGVLQLINFAHSEVFITGGIVAYLVFDALKNSGTNGYIKLLLACLAAMVVSGALNVLIERLAYRPLRGAQRLVPLITAIGVSLILQDLLRFLVGLRGQFDLSVPLPTEFAQSITKVAGVDLSALNLQVKDIILIVVAALMLVGLNLLVNRTQLGRAIRAVAHDRQTSGLMGIDSNRIISLTFLIGGALGGLGGVMFAMKYQALNAYSGTVPGLKAFTAAVLGGIGNIPGAVLGGLVLGWLETLLGVISLFGSLPGLHWLSAVKAEYKDIGAFLALILILFLKPAGLLGKATTEKV